MKIQFRLLALFLSMLLLPGCAACPKKKNAVETPAPADAAAMVATPVIQQDAPVAPVASAKPVTEKIPAAVLK